MHRRRTSRPPFSSALRVLTAALLALVIGGDRVFSTPEPALAAGESPTILNDKSGLDFKEAQLGKAFISAENLAWNEKQHDHRLRFWLVVLG